jgi:hypothetical protein
MPNPNGTPPTPDPEKPWGTKTSSLPQYVMNDLYQVYPFLDRDTRQRLGLMMKIPVFLQDPQVAAQNPSLAIDEIEVRLESGFSDGPTSSRIVIVDYNADTRQLIEPLIWVKENGWFKVPSAAGQEPAWLAEPPSRRIRKPEPHLKYIQSVIQNPHFHQLNVWAVVQRVLEFYEEPWALGRPVPWGFDGNRLIVVPHAGYGENAFYDHTTKSLQFYYYGDLAKPSYTCLSHDIVSHETGHAILDGVRPLYNNLSSLQTPAFHEFIGDLTAIMLALFNNDIRRYVAKSTGADFSAATVLANLAEEFGQKLQDRPYLRSALNQETMSSIKGSLSPHDVSQVLTGAMFEILDLMGKKRMALSAAQPGRDDEGQVISAASLLWQTAHRFRRIALQPLDLCPPCDIQFIDYASAVIRNDMLSNPVDPDGIRDIMLSVFHRRGLCPCEYAQGQPLPQDCLFLSAQEMGKQGFVFHDLERVSRSRTAAYYFLSDNRRVLRIPPHQDVKVLDLYDTIKYGASGEKLPRQVVLEYGWQERVALNNDASAGLDFRTWDGKTFNMDCGGTLVFDERGNLLSWFRKPGTEHLSPQQLKDLSRKARPTELEKAALADYKAGQQRKKDVLSYLSGLMQRGLVGSSTGAGFSDGLKPVMASEAPGGTVSFHIAGHLRDSEFQPEAPWKVNY